MVHEYDPQAVHHEVEGTEDHLFRKCTCGTAARGMMALRDCSFMVLELRVNNFYNLITSRTA